MNLLAIDVGNTNTEFAFFHGEKLDKTWRLSTLRHRTADEYALFLYQMMQHAGIERGPIDAAMLACVVPDALYPIRRMCASDLAVPLTELGTDRLELGIAIETEGDVGADRLVNAAEAWRRYGEPLIVVDFGTATTFDVVGDGAFLGGVIAPGVNLSLEALKNAAAKLPAIRVRRPSQVIGRSTVPAMESGIFYGYLGLVDGIVGRIAAEYGAPMRVIATGGLASLYAPFSEAIDETVEDLTIWGLYSIFNSNRKT